MIDKRKPTPGVKTVRVEVELSDKQIKMLFSKRRFTHVILCDRRMPNPRTFIKGLIVGVGDKVTIDYNKLIASYCAEIFEERFPGVAVPKSKKKLVAALEKSDGE